MEFLVEFIVSVPAGTPGSEVTEREGAEADSAAHLAREDHLRRLWTADGGGRIIGLYQAASREELDGLLDGLPLRSWMQISVTPLQPHRNDPGS